MSFLAISFGSEMECTLQEERSLKVQVEGKLLQLKKDYSMLDCDYKQAENKLDEFQAQKEKLSEEVCPKWNMNDKVVTLAIVLKKWSYIKY